ncbi:MAG: AAA family ATPase, partial [Planctomycetes bacterium]|nr:AAA family ATPase [Planctomycetota bacterium]
MYCDFFGLRCRPFEDRADTQFFFTAADCEEALAAMDYEAHYGKGMALVLGEAGTGKTLLIRILLQRLHASDHVVVLTWAQSGKMNLIRETAKAFGVSLPPSHQDARSLARLRRHLPRALKSNRRSILIIDQAENLTTDNMAELSTLGDLQHNDHKLLSIILVGHPRFRSLLEQPAFSRIAQQLYGEHTLSPLTASDTEKYVAHRLRISGAATVNLFDREAVALIHEASKGIPRLINHMCDAAMLAAYGAGEARISRQTAAEVTSTTCPRERTAEARDLGIISVDRVAPGRASPTPGFLGQSSQTSEVVEDAPQPAEHSGLPLTDEHDSFSPAHGEENELIAVDTYQQEIATPQPASTMLHSEELLIRLERALARADRTNATTEASLAQFTAVEKHLASLTEGAERLVGSLGQAAERGTESLDSAHVRLEDMLGQGGDCIRAIETQTARTSEVLREAREHADCVEHACEHADKVEARLKSIAERLADGADEVQDRVGLLMAGVGSGEETHNRLADLLKQASRIAGDFEGTVTGLRTKLQDTIDEGKRFQQTFTDSAFEAYRTKVNERIERYEGQALKAVESTQNKLESIAKQASSITTDANKETQSLRTTLAETKSETERFLKLFTDSALRRCREKLQEQLEVHLRKQQEAVASAITAHRAKLQEVIDDAASRARTVDEALAASQKAGEEAIARSQRSHTETLEAINRKTELLRQQLDALDQREGRIRSSAASLSDTLTGTKAEVIALSDSVEGVEASVDELTTRADAAGTSLSNVVLHGEKLLVNVQTTVGQIEATQHRVAATLLEVGGA